MSDQLGLRERKKLRTREAISEAATALFLDRGFDSVSVADVAAAADVSKMTVFNYFPAKEDLVLCQIDDHVDEAAAAVRQREPGEPPLAALHRHFLASLASRDPYTGLADNERFLAFQRMVVSTPSLKLRLMEQGMRSVVSLAAALAEATGELVTDVAPVIAANQVIAVHQALVVRNLERILAGARADEVYDTAAGEANTAFELLSQGLARYGSGVPAER
jgi:AcrR family transcriptional regulator